MTDETMMNVAATSRDSQFRLLFLIGVPKAATTSLAAVLGSHPDICVSTPKETCFHILGPPNPDVSYVRQFFPDPPDSKLLCDASVLNLYFCDTTAPAIAQAFPDAKILVVLRDPIARAISDFASAVSAGIEVGSFESAFRHEEARLGHDKWPLHPRIYFRRGKYRHQLQTFQYYFARSQFLVLTHEQLLAHPDASLCRIAQFLEVQPWQKSDALWPNLNPRLPFPRFPLLQRSLRGDHPLAPFLTSLFPHHARPWLRSLATRLRRRLLTSPSVVNLRPVFLEELLQFYREEYQFLPSEWDLDTSSWTRTRD